MSVLRLAPSGTWTSRGLGQLHIRLGKAQWTMVAASNRKHDVLDHRKRDFTYMRSPSYLGMVELDTVDPWTVARPLASSCWYCRSRCDVDGFCKEEAVIAGFHIQEVRASFNNRM